MTVKDIITQIEHVYGRQPRTYMLRLINDALNEIATKRFHNKRISKEDLISNQRFYDIPKETIDIQRVEIMDNDGVYELIPKTADPHLIDENSEN
jgi:hypothetical protein